MHALSDDLTDLASAIVHGAEPSPKINATYGHYSADVAIEVYRNNYRGNLHDALAGAYPVIKQLVGDDFFRHLARHYITRFPSQSGNLHHYGAGMAEFVTSFEPAQSLVYLPDVAALEWACHRSYFADDASTLDIARLALVPHDQYADLILHTHPSCHLIRSPFPVAAIWHAHQPGADSNFQIDLDNGPCNALVIRNQENVKVSEMPDAEADWLHAIQNATTLGDATAEMLSRYPEFDLQAALLKLVAQGALSGFSLRTK